MKKKFCCEATRGMYEDYYKRQSGGEIPVFAGARHQRGHGLGGVLSGLFRKVVPFVKDNVKNIGKNLLRTGADIAQDMIEGKKFKEAARQRLPRGLKRTVEDVEWKSVHPRVKTVGSRVLKVGADLVGDVAEGTPFRKSIRRRIKEGARDLRGQTGNGRSRRHIKRARLYKDIFG